MELETQQPHAVMEMDINPATGDQAYFSVSSSKLKWLYLATFGLYGIYWFYKNWKLQQPFIDGKIMPVMRGIFSIFFTHALASRIKQSMSRQDIPENKHLGFLATMFVILVVLGNLASTLADNHVVPEYFNIIWLVLFYLSAYPLIELQDKINMLKDDPIGAINSRYDWRGYAALLIGGILWLLAILGAIALVAQN